MDSLLPGNLKTAYEGLVEFVLYKLKVILLCSNPYKNGEQDYHITVMFIVYHL